MGKKHASQYANFGSLHQLRNKDKKSYFHIPMWYGISRLLIVKKCIKNIDCNINRLIYTDIPYSKAKE